MKIKKGDWYLGQLNRLFDYDIEYFPPRTQDNIKSKFMTACRHLVNYESKKCIGVGFSTEYYVVCSRGQQELRNLVESIYTRNTGRYLINDIPKLTNYHVASNYVFIRHNNSIADGKTVGDTRPGGFKATPPDTSGVIYFYLCNYKKLHLGHSTSRLSEKFKYLTKKPPKNRIPRIGKSIDYDGNAVLCTYPGSEEHLPMIVETYKDLLIPTSGPPYTYLATNDILLRLWANFEIAEDFKDIILDRIGSDIGVLV